MYGFVMRISQLSITFTCDHTPGNGITVTGLEALSEALLLNRSLVDLELAGEITAIMFSIAEYPIFTLYSWRYVVLGG